MKQRLSGHCGVIHACTQVNGGFSFLPSPVSRKLQHSGGSPEERCHCSAERVQSERLSEGQSDMRFLPKFKPQPYFGKLENSDE